MVPRISLFLSCTIEILDSQYLAQVIPLLAFWCVNLVSLNYNRGHRSYKLLIIFWLLKIHRFLRFMDLSSHFELRLLFRRIVCCCVFHLLLSWTLRFSVVCCHVYSAESNLIGITCAIRSVHLCDSLQLVQLELALSLIPILRGKRRSMMNPCRVFASLHRFKLSIQVFLPCRVHNLER